MYFDKCVSCLLKKFEREFLFDEWQRVRFFFSRNLLVAYYRRHFFQTEIDLKGIWWVSCFMWLTLGYIIVYNKLFMTWWITTQTSGGCDKTTWIFKVMNFWIFSFSIFLEIIRESGMSFFLRNSRWIFMEELNLFFFLFLSQTANIFKTNFSNGNFFVTFLGVSVWTENHTW